MKIVQSRQLQKNFSTFVIIAKTSMAVNIYVRASGWMLKLVFNGVDCAFTSISTVLYEITQEKNIKVIVKDHNNLSGLLMNQI